MAYQTSTYSSFNNALDLLQSFINSLTAWTVDSFVDDASKYAGDVFTGKRLHVHRGDEHFNFRSATNQQVFEGSTVQTLGIAMYGARGYASGDSWDYQSGGTLDTVSKSIGGHCNAMLPAGVYHFFADADEKAVTAVFESSYPNVFVKMSFGILSNGWQFFASNDLNGTAAHLFTHIASSSQSTSAFSKAVYNPAVGQWTTGNDNGTLVVNTLVSPLSVVASTNAPFRSAFNVVNYSPNPLTGNPVVCPCHFWRITTTSQYQYLGHVPDLFITSMRYYVNAQEVIMPNGDVFLVFKNNYSDSSIGGSGAGVAIKKVV